MYNIIDILEFIKQKPEEKFLRKYESDREE